jgi:hypothetical protein
MRKLGLGKHILVYQNYWTLEIFYEKEIWIPLVATKVMCLKGLSVTHPFYKLLFPQFTRRASMRVRTNRRESVPTTGHVSRQRSVGGVLVE